MCLNNEVESFSGPVGPHSGHRDECFGPDVTFDPAGSLAAARWCSSPSHRPHSSSRLDRLHHDRTASALAAVAARLRLLAAENRVPSRARGGVNVNAAISLLQRYQDGR